MDIKSRIAIAKNAFNKRRKLSMKRMIKQLKKVINLGLECRIAWIRNLDIENVRERQIGNI